MKKSLLKGALPLWNVCPHCKGTGLVHYRSLDGFDFEKYCPLCAGHGRILKEELVVFFTIGVPVIVIARVFWIAITF